MLIERIKSLSEVMYMLRIRFYEKIRNNKKCKEKCILYINKNPNSYLAHKKLAEIYEKEGGMRKAIDEYVKAVEIDRKDYDSYYKISFLLNELGKTEDAIVMLNNLIEKKPDHLKANMLLADIFYFQEMYKEALNVYVNILNYVTNSDKLYYNIGIVYTMLNDFQNAKRSYERALELNDSLYNAYYSLGQINLIEMDLDEAERYFNKCLENKDGESDAYYNLGHIYMLKGIHDEAVRLVNLAIGIDSNYIKIANQEPIFIPIKSKFKMKIIDEEDIEPRKITYNEKEKSARKHLEETYNVVGKLNIHKLKPKVKY